MLASIFFLFSDTSKRTKFSFTCHHPYFYNLHSHSFRKAQTPHLLLQKIAMICLIKLVDVEQRASFDALSAPFGQRPWRSRWAMLSHMRGVFLLLLLHLLIHLHPSPPSTQILASRPNAQSRGLNPSHETQIPASRPKSQPQGPNPSFNTQILASRPKSLPWGPNPILKTQILVSRPKFNPSGPNLSLKA